MAKVNAVVNRATMRMFTPRDLAVIIDEQDDQDADERQKT